MDKYFDNPRTNRAKREVMVCNSDLCVCSMDQKTCDGAKFIHTKNLSSELTINYGQFWNVMQKMRLLILNPFLVLPKFCSHDSSIT